MGSSSTRLSLSWYPAVILHPIIDIIPYILIILLIPMITIIIKRIRFIFIIMALRIESLNLRHQVLSQHDLQKLNNQEAGDTLFFPNMSFHMMGGVQGWNLTDVTIMLEVGSDYYFSS